MINIYQVQLDHTSTILVSKESVWDGTHVGDSIHGSTEAYTFLTLSGKFKINNTLKTIFLCEHTDIPEYFLNASTYVAIVVVGGFAKGRNNLNVNSSSQINGLIFSWNDKGLRLYSRELLVDIEKQNAIEMEHVSSCKGMSNINGRQDYFHFPGLTTDDWD